MTSVLRALPSQPLVSYKKTKQTFPRAKNKSDKKARTCIFYVHFSVRIESGIYRNILKSCFLSVEHAAGFFLSNTCILTCSTWYLKSEFSSKTLFLDHFFGEMSHKTCSYAPYGPFRFSANSEFWCTVFHQTLTFGKNPLFQSSVELNSLHGSSFLK